MTDTYKWIVLSAAAGHTGPELECLAAEYKNIPDSDPRLNTPSAKRLIALLEAPPTDNTFVLCYPDKNYPKKLKLLKNPPPVLYVRGDPKLLSRPKSIAVVGSRQASAYGLTVTADFCRDFCERGFVIISGGAKGIDSAAAQTALKFGGATIAVLGCGIDVAYPSENRAMFEKIVKNGGALVSEYPFGTRPTPAYFPLRNRIIAALADGCVVTEAGLRSGSLITANLVADLRKPLFAVPGNITSRGSSGTNHLISTGARMGLNGMQIASDIELMLSFSAAKERIPSKFVRLTSENTHKPSPPAKASAPTKKRPSLSPEEEKIFAAVTGGKTLAELSDALQIGAEALIPALTMLEMKGIIAKGFGGKYEKR